MTESLSRFASISPIVCLLALYGCGNQMVLDSKSAAVPAGIDLSGNWLVRSERPVADVPRASNPDDALVLMSQRQRQLRARQRRPSDASAQVFLEFGSSLKITQTNHGMFISYDRSIVEEYTFGENRIVSVGPIEAQRVSGWHGNRFVVETLDTTDTILFETWYLESEGSVLVRDIRLSKDEKDSYAQRQIFDRRW